MVSLQEATEGIRNATAILNEINSFLDRQSGKVASNFQPVKPSDSGPALSESLSPRDRSQAGVSQAAFEALGGRPAGQPIKRKERIAERFALGKPVGIGSAVGAKTKQAASAFFASQATFSNPFATEQEKSIAVLNRLGGSFVPGGAKLLKAGFNTSGITKEQTGAVLARQNFDSFIATQVAAGVDPTPDQLKDTANIFTKIGQEKARLLERSKKFISQEEDEVFEKSELFLESMQEIVNFLKQTLRKTINFTQTDISVGGF